MKRCVLSACLILAASAAGQPGSDAKRIRLRGEIVDTSGTPLPGRIYIEGADGTWHFPTSDGGTAIPYRKQRPDNPRSVEMHTTLSAHPFHIDLPPGKYTLTVERGKEY